LIGVEDRVRTEHLFDEAQRSGVIASDPIYSAWWLRFGVKLLRL
jgi:hypothetical protein